MKSQQLSRRQFLNLTGMALGATMLAACAPQPAQAPAGNEATGSSPAQEPITIRYGRHDPGNGVNVTIEAFSEEYPTIKVEMEQIGEYHAKIPALAAAGTLPDVVRSWEAMLFEMVRGGQFIDLQSFVDAEPEFDPEDFYEEWWNYPVVEGKRYGIGDAVATHITYYNVDLFDAAGVEYPNPESFTWDDYAEKARAISDPDNQIWGSETIPVGWHYYTLKQVWQNNGDFYSEDYKVATVDQPATIDAVQFWADMLLDGNVMPSPSQITGIGGAGAAAELLGAGKIGMQRMGSWITRDLMDKNIRFNIVPEPSKERRATIAHGGLNAITSGSPHKNEAWTWVSYNSSTQGIYNYASDARFPGARRSTNLIEPHPWEADVDFEVNWDIIPQSLEYGRILPGPCNEGEVLKIIGDALEQIYAGNGKAADVLPQIAPQVTSLLQDC
jgi:multiple sugar transport system substrate-binding protein